MSHCGVYGLEMINDMDWKEDHFTLVEGFPRPNWETINDKISNSNINKDENDLWCEIASAWINKIKSVLSTEYSTYDSNNFILLTPMKWIHNEQ